MNTVNLNIRMDSKLKKDFEAFCDDVGLSMTAAITIFAKRVVRDNKIPFTIESNIPNNETLKAIKEAQKIMKDPSSGKTYTDVDQMMEEILKDAKNQDN